MENFDQRNLTVFIAQDIDLFRRCCPIAQICPFVDNGRVLPVKYAIIPSFSFFILAFWVLFGLYRQDGDFSFYFCGLTQLGWFYFEMWWRWINFIIKEDNLHPRLRLGVESDQNLPRRLLLKVSLICMDYAINLAVD